MTRQAPRVGLTTYFKEAAWGDWRRWKFFDRTHDGQVRAWLVDGWTGSVTQRFAGPARREAAATVPGARLAMTRRLARSGK